MSSTAYDKAQQGILWLQEAILLFVTENADLNTTTIGEKLGINDIGEVEQKGHVQRAILFSLMHAGKIESIRVNERGEHHWKVKG